MDQVRIITLALALFAATAPACATAPRAEVIHWWTSGGESAAVKQIAQAYRNAGGVWIDAAIAGGDQARAVTLNRLVGGNPPTAAQFNTSMQFVDLVEQGMLNNVDDIAQKQGWDQTLPAPLVNVIKVKGHYYAVPLNIHMQAWIWYSKEAFKKAGISAEPETMDQLFAAFDKLKAAGIVPLAHGGQAWQETVLFSMVLANLGGKDLYLAVLRERDQRAIASDGFKKVLLAFKRMHNYIDAGAPGRNWNDATALLISGKAGVQVMGDWAKGEFTAAHQVADQQYGCLPGLGPKAPYLMQGDVFVFPKTSDLEALKAQKLLANVIVAPATQLAFSKLKGSIPMRSDVDARQLDACAQKGLAVMKDPSRQVGVTEVYLTPDQNGAMQDVLTAFWNTGMTADKAQKSFAAALKN